MPHNASQGLPSGLLNIEPGTGGKSVFENINILSHEAAPTETDHCNTNAAGGCIETGPFAGMIANISATAPVDTYQNVTVGDFLSYEPRCVKRDISNALGQTWANDSMIADLLSNPLYQDGIGAWQDWLQYTGTDTDGFYGLHAYGHMTINGDPSTDVSWFRFSGHRTLQKFVADALTCLVSFIIRPMSPRSGFITPRLIGSSGYGRTRTF